MIIIIIVVIVSIIIIMTTDDFPSVAMMNEKQRNNFDSIVR
jgi:hypothetical protein